MWNQPTAVLSHCPAFANGLNATDDSMFTFKVEWKATHNCPLSISKHLKGRSEEVCPLALLAHCWSQIRHYWLRSIKGGQFRLVNFASHFIRVQIFQIDFPLILSASKYFRYISLSFYICRGQNEHFSINSVRKTGRVELCQIFHPSNWCTDICKTPIPTFKPQFHIFYWMTFLYPF